MEAQHSSRPCKRLLAYCVSPSTLSCPGVSQTDLYAYRNLAATMFAPGAASLAEDFQISSPTIVSLTVSIYLAGLAIGPMLIAPLSELYGRLVVYHTCSITFIGFIIGCALSKNTAMFLAFRVFAGCAASGPATVGGGTVADVVPPAQRGKAMSLFFIGPLLGPVRNKIPQHIMFMLTFVKVLGPIIGGFVSESIGWRWTFWIITILVSSAPLMLL